MTDPAQVRMDELAAQRAEHRTHSIRMAWRDALLATLRDAANQRDLRLGLVDTAAGPEFEWVMYERLAMLDAVNDLREIAGLSSVAAEAIARVERQAAGHVDYAEKFALYCAELALGETAVKP